jgi:uncharacterized protein YbjT (DUF2867 family)
MHVLRQEKAAGVTHHVGLSLLGADRVGSGYFSAKLAQELRIKRSGVPYTILRAPQCFEQLESIADDATTNGSVRLPHVPIRPVAADDVAMAIAHLDLGAPANSTFDLAGPDLLFVDQLVATLLWRRQDSRRVVADARAPYLGAVLDHGDCSLLPALLTTTTRYEDWMETQTRT